MNGRNPSGLAELLRLIPGIGGKQTAQAARTATRPRVTQSGGRAVRGAGTIPVGPTLAGGAVAAPVQGIGLGAAGAIGSAVLAEGIFKLLESGLGPALQVASQQAGGGTPVPVASSQTEKYLMPMDSPLAYQQNYQREMFNRALLGSLPFGLGSSIVQNLPEYAPPLTQREVNDLNQIAMIRAGERERELARIRGELAALPSAYQAIGTQSQALGGALQSAINTILQRAPIEKSLALQSIATKNQFSN